MNTVSIFLAGSTKAHDYEPVRRMLEGMQSSLESEWAERAAYLSSDTNPDLPKLVVHTAVASMEQPSLDQHITRSDVTIFFLDETDAPGEILRHEMETALGSFLRTGKPFPYLFVAQADTSQVPVQDMDEIYRKFGFMQYRVVYQRNSPTDYVADLYKIVSSALLDNRLAGDDCDRRRVVRAHMPAAVRGISTLDDMRAPLVYCGMYLCNRLLYNAGVNVSFSPTANDNRNAVRVTGINRGGNPTSFTLYFNTNSGLHGIVATFDGNVKVSVASSKHFDVDAAEGIKGDVQLARYIDRRVEQIERRLSGE